MSRNLPDARIAAIVGRRTQEHLPAYVSTAANLIVVEGTWYAFDERSPAALVIRSLWLYRCFLDVI